MPKPASGPVAAYQHGIYPRSERVVQATRDIERGRTTPQHVDEAFAADRAEFLDLQRRAGLDFLSDGLLRWQDLFRPLVDGSEGMEAQVLVRWFDNNSFIRAPDLRGVPKLTGLPGWVLEDGIPEPRVATLPSPYLFSRAVRPPGQADRLVEPLARDVIAPAVRELVGAGSRLIHLEEPWLVFFGIREEWWQALEHGLEAIREAAAGVPVVFHVYYGDAAPYAQRLARLPVDAVGIDFTETNLDDLPARWPIGLAAGCLDGRRSVLEPVDQVVDFARRVADRLAPATLFLTSSSDLELLGPEVARRKVEVLGEAAGRLRAGS